MILSSYVPCPWGPSNCNQNPAFTIASFPCKNGTFISKHFLLSEEGELCRSPSWTQSFWKFCSTIFLLVLGWLVLVLASVQFYSFSLCLLAFMSASVCTATASAVIVHLPDLLCGQSIHWNKSCIVSLALLHRNSAFLCDPSYCAASTVKREAIHGWSYTCKAFSWILLLWNKNCKGKCVAEPCPMCWNPVAFSESFGLGSKSIGSA